jgi:hypothetical protein
VVFLKTFHFISLWAAGGLGVGGWVLQHVHKRNEQRPSAEVVQSIFLMGLLQRFQEIKKILRRRLNTRVANFVHMQSGIVPSSLQ